MPSCSNSNSNPDTVVNQIMDDKVFSDEKPSKREDDEDEEDEEEDADFNPSFLKETLSPEASSSLSSEVEAFDGDAVESSVQPPNSPTLAAGDEEEAEKQNAVSSDRLCEKDAAPAAAEEETNDPVPRELAKLATDSDADDAICTRTRAKHSLASFTLDELETFLQETDDEDDLHNVDDEEEYRKFLSFVLQGDGAATGDHGDEEEDNDADFEVELEEALESSDADENPDEDDVTAAVEAKRPQTRQNNRCQRAKADSRKKNHSEPSLETRNLRPIFPVYHYSQVPSFTAQPIRVDSFSSSNTNAFTQQQIGQLHCLIHEHVQLLLQTFCLCSGDPSGKGIASQTQKMILEIVERRDQVAAWKTAPYPRACFQPMYLLPLEPGDILKSVPESLRTADDETPCSRNSEAPFWVPCVNDPVTSILDVAPLSLVRKFFDVVQSAVRESRLYTVESSSDSRFVREPLFPLPGYLLDDAQADSEASISSPSQQPSKKTFAAKLVERTKKQSAALVPIHIMKSAQMFLPLFNPEFYPHKPPAGAVANRILFTDSEDALLAMGILEYNTDWKAIQQRFLPCKSKHQIFVRQKNRCSSKARENPIKAVRRMKTSPLTEEEIACINEGLKAYKCNLMMVWQLIVPHRDPSLLPRQWRVAHGTQKSYKISAEAKERRRVSEANKRKSRAASLAISQNKERTRVETLNRHNNNMEENVGKTYVHEAFMAGWRPPDSNEYSGSTPTSNRHNTNMLLPHGVSQIQQPHRGNMHQHFLPPATFVPHHPFHFPDIRQSGGPPNATLITPKPQSYTKPYEIRNSYGTNLVKLAPGLPTLNLPPSVRIVSQSSAFREPRPPSVSVPVSALDAHIASARENDNSAEDSGIPEEKFVDDDDDDDDERSNDTDRQMHPLLFRAAAAADDDDDGPLPYNCSGASGSRSFSFFSGNQPQLNLSLLHNPLHENHGGSFPSPFRSTDAASSSQGIDFHPLLQRTEYVLQYPYGAVNSEAHVTGKSVEKSNELDLEIHLSSRADKLAKSISAAQDSDFGVEFQTSEGSFYRDSENYLPSFGNPGSGVHSPVLPTDGGSRYLDDMCDQSNPGIVMEQEELSDSDEENEENVEFECEEMTDSEGDEGSGCEQIAETQIEEGHRLAMEKMSSDYAPRPRSHPHEKLPSRRKKTPTLGLGFTSQGKEDASNSSWLSLDSSGSQHCPENTTGDGNKDRAIQKENLGTKSPASSRPSRSCKKKNPSSEQLDQRRPVNGGRKTSSAPPRIPILRKPRKRGRRDDASSNIELKVHNANPKGDD